MDDEYTRNMREYRRSLRPSASVAWLSEILADDDGGISFNERIGSTEANPFVTLTLHVPLKTLEAAKEMARVKRLARGASTESRA